MILETSHEFSMKSQVINVTVAYLRVFIIAMNYLYLTYTSIQPLKYEYGYDYALAQYMYNQPIMLPPL